MSDKFVILIIDDMISNLVSIEALILEHFDVTVVKAMNGEEGLKVLFKQHVDLILSDVQMPVMDGFEFVRMLKKNKKFELIPFIFITAMHTTDESVKEGLELGASDYIRKPINSSIFISKLKVFINLYNAQDNLHKANEKLKKQFRQLQEQEAHLIQQSRLAQMGEMISMIAHQWRQPLASISSIANTLLIDAELDAVDKEFLINRLHSVSDLASHLSQTVDDFRDFFKPDKTPKSFSLSAAIEETLHVVEPLTFDIEVSKSMKCDIEVKTYKNELTQVLLNVLNNAIDAIKEQKGSSGRISLNLFKDEKNAIIEITDNAGGIPESIIDKVFDPYFSTKSKNGTGLGLYMSKIIIENHCKGAIRVSNNGEGACFTIAIPLPIA